MPELDHSLAIGTLEHVGGRREADAIAEHIAEPDELDLTIDDDGNDRPDGTVVAELLPPGWQSKHTIINNERWRPTPGRPRGTTTVQDGDSFATAVLDQRLDSGDVGDDTTAPGGPYEPRVYARENDKRVTAVLNQTQGTTLGWGDYRVELQLQRTPEWNDWLSGQGLHAQAVFADFIEEHLDEIAPPDEAYPNLLEPADLLDMAQHFQLHQTADFKRSERLHDGQVQLTYEENNEARAGQSGQITIPEEIHMLMRPFVGSDVYRVKARFRYRLTGGALKIGYKVQRPDDIERGVFLDETTKIAELLQLPIIKGSVPAVTPLAS